MKNIKPCKECANYNKQSCPHPKNFRWETRKRILEDYDFDCFQDALDKAICDLICGEPEND